MTEKTVKDWAAMHPAAATSLLGWLATTKAAHWQSLADVRQTYPHADPVSVASARTVTVFNIAGNKYRLIASIHYNTGIVFTLMFLTHAEYSKDRWKKQL